MRLPAKVRVLLCVFLLLTGISAKAFFIPSGKNNSFFHKLVPYATVTSTATGGAWSNPSTWSTGVVPTSNDDVVIPLGSTVTIDADNLSCQSITINGTLAGNGSFNLNVYGNWLNNGSYTATIDTVRFAGSTNATISGTSATTFNNIKIDKSGNTSAIVEAIGGSGVTNNGNISLANGIFKVSSGIFQFKSNPNIPSTAGLWVNGGLVNSVSASFSIDNNGLVRVSAGTLNVGTSSGNSLTTSGSTGKLEITGGVVNIAGRLENTNGSAVISGGVITVSMIGNGLSSTGAFHISANTDLNMSGGTVVFQNPGTASTPIDLYIVGGGTGTKNITGGTFQFGNSSTPASSTFLVNSVAPVYNLSINNANTPSVKLTTVGTAYDLSISNQLTLAGGILDANGKEIIVSNPSITAISRSAGYVIGVLKRAISGIGSYSFHVGTANGYTPVNLNFTGGSFSGAYASIQSINAKHVANTSATDYLNRYWDISVTGISNPVYNVTATYLVGDIVGNIFNVKAAKYTTVWSKTGSLNDINNTINFSSISDMSLSISGVLGCDLAANSSSTDVFCFGGNTGTMTATVTGGTAPFSYTIAGPTVNTTGASSGIFTGLSAGPYTITVKDANGCTTTVPVTITQPSAALSASITSQTDVLCFGNSTGSVTVAGANGTSPYTYSKDGVTFVGSGTFGSLSAGPYTITVKDANGCTTTVPVTITQPSAALSVSANSNTPVCSGTSLNLSSSASGGTGTITYSWSGPNSFASALQNPSIPNVQVAGTGVYTLTAKDANGCTASNTTNVTIIQSVTPSVIISANPGNNICAGTSVTFTATPTNGGTTPSYQWKVNGVNVGTNSATFTPSTLNNTDKVTVVMTSSATCPSPATGTSNQITMTVNDLVVPSVSVSASTTTICPGTSVTFTATAINGGAAPTYQWEVNGTNVGTNSTTFSSLTLNNNDVVTVVMTSNAACASPASVTSTPITITVTPAPVPAVSVSASATTICIGTSVTFTATPTNGGSTPVYQWKVNGMNVGTNSSTFTSSSLNNNDAVTVVLTSNAACASPTTATSAAITMTVNPTVVPSVSITPSATTICPGTSVNFTANPTNGGSTPVYQWQVNGTNVGTNSSTFTSSSLNNGDVVKVILTSNATCASPTTANSSVAMTVNPGPPATPGAITGSTEQCINKTGLTYSISSVTNATSYTWTVPANWTITSGQGTTSITVSTSGTATSGNITVTATNSCGTSSAQTLAVIASTGPPATPATPSPAVGQANSICPVATGLVYSIPAVAGATSYTWNVPVGWTITSGQGTTSITVTAGVQTAGNKNISVTATNACGSATSNNLVVTVGTFASVDAGADQTVCAGTPSINLSATVAGATNAANDLTWTAPAGSFSNPGKANTSYTIPASILSGGTMTITVTARAEGTCPAVSDQMILTVLPNPTASISGSTTICSGKSSTITFTGTANTTVTYKINGGANQTINIGASGTASLNTGNLTTTTTYTLVSVGYTTAPSCSQTVSGAATIIVNSLPIVNAGTYSPVCEGSSSITLTGTPAGGSFSGTGVTGNSFNPTTAGSYTITYSYTDPNTGCSNSATATITVNAKPSLTITNPATVCSPSTVNLTAAAVTAGSNLQGGALSYWTDANATSSLSNPNAVASSGTYYIKITTASGCSDIKPVVVTINPAATVSAGSNQTICSNSTATMAGSFGGGATSGTWSTSGSGSFSNNTPTAVYTPSSADITAGSVTLTYTTDDPTGPCGSVSGNMTLTIKKAVVITTQPSNTNVCSGFSADMVVVATGDNLTYQWYKGSALGGVAVTNSSNISGAQSATLHFNQAGAADDGMYYVVVSGASQCAPVTSASRTLNVDQAINIITQPASQTLCVGTNATFTIVADANGESLTYQWRKNGGNIAGKTSSTLTLTNITTADAGNYDVVVNGPAGYTCSSAISSPASLTVNQNSTISLSSVAGTDAQTKCVNTAITPITYAIGGGGTGASITAGALPSGVTGSFSNGVFTISGTPTASGTFNYTITTSGPCTNVTAIGTITVDQNSTLGLTSASGTNDQTICINTAITPITYTAGGGATNVTVSGLPTGVTGNFNSGVFTISGSPSVNGVFNYTVTTTGPCNNVSLNGKITVNQNSTLTLTSGSTNQTICINTVVGNIVYTVGGGATGATVSGLPTGVTGSYNNGTFTISGTPSTAGTFNYTVTTTGPCNNVSLLGSIKVDPTATGGTIAPAITTLCANASGGSLTLSGYSGTIIRWESSTNGGATWTPIANTSPTQSYSSSQTTLYRAVIQSGTCPVVYSSVALVSVIPTTTPTVTANPATICAGQSSVLTSSSGLSTSTSGVDGSFNTANPAGWCVNGQCSGSFMSANGDNQQTGPWRETNPHDFVGINYTSPNPKFAIANGIFTSTLETPVFNLIGQSPASLDFLQSYILCAGSSARIEISTNGGATYSAVLAQYTGATSLGITGNNSTMQNTSISLANYIGLSNLRIKFTYVGTCNTSAWVIDGVSFPGTSTPITYTLSGSDGSSYTGQTVTVTPASTTTYTLTAMMGTCVLGSANVIVTVFQLPTVTTVNSCIGGGTVTFTQSGGAAAGTWTVNGGGTINASTGAFTPTTAGCFTATYKTPGPGCTDTKNFVVYPAPPPAPIVNSGCGAIMVTAPPTVSGFNIEYSFDDGDTWGTNTPPTADNCTGYIIKTRYVTAAACGAIPAGTAGTGSCGQSPAKIRKVDNTKPMLTCPTVSPVCAVSGNTYTIPSLTASDNCSASSALTISYSIKGATTRDGTGLDASGIFNAGVSTITWTVTDECGNSNTCTTQVIINPKPTPTIYHN